jgi:hypothetical protein
MIWALFLGLGLGCSDKGGLVSDVIAIEISPKTKTLYTRSGEPAEYQFVAVATFKDGSSREIDLVSWSLSNLSVGEIESNGWFTSVDTNGGVTEVIANHVGVEAVADLDVIYESHELLEGVDEAVIDAFASASPTPDVYIEIIYPFDGVMVPRNIEGFGFKWYQADNHNMHRLRLSSEVTELSVYLGDENSWVATAELWKQAAAANRDGKIEVYLESGVWDGSSLTDVRMGPSIEMTVNRLDARGSVLYWGTSDGAVMRIPFGETEPTHFWPPASESSCVGCHVINEEREKMVVGYGGFDGAWELVDLADPDDPVSEIAPDRDYKLTFKTVSPSGEYMVGTNEGEVYIYDLVTGYLLDQVDFDYPMSHPDWSPDGDSILMAQIRWGFNTDMDFDGAEIVKVPWENGELGEPEVLIAYSDVYNYYYPAWSPDGEWIAYNKTSAGGEVETSSSYASMNAELWLMDKNGEHNIYLFNANGAEGRMNSYPRWGPLPDDEVLWLAYSSRQEYPLSGQYQPQIFVSGIDTEKAELGLDPSYAPFWLPGQEANSDNHLPVWWSK